MESLSNVVSGNLGKAIEELDKLLRSPRTRVEILSLHRQMKTVTSELGTKTLELYKAGRVEDLELAELCARIVSIEARIAERETRLAAQAQASQRAAPAQPAGANCPRCNTPLVDDATFCSKCGLKVTAPGGASPVTTGYYCAQCGRELRSEAKFCPRCGSPA